jgi:hypothetical protein
MGLLLTALTYLSASIGEQKAPARRALVWIGCVAVLPCTALEIVMGLQTGFPRYRAYLPSLPTASLAAGCIVAVLGPLALAWFLRGRAAWINVLWAVWVYGLILAAYYRASFGSKNVGATLALYLLCAAGSVGLVAWGLREHRKERVNLGIAAFAFTVLFFYFDSFMDKLGRSESLLLLGVLCLAGGYGLERTRRRLVARMELRI